MILIAAPTHLRLLATQVKQNLFMPGAITGA